jgi:hypothetical protein
MNPIQTTIAESLSKIGSPLEPLVAVSERYLRFCSAVDLDETLMIGHQPWKGPQAYAVRIFPSARKSWFSRYPRLRGFKLSMKYREILAAANGCYAFGLSLYGIPPSMMEKQPGLNRSKAQCLDIGSANLHWKSEFPDQEERFHFGSRHYSYTQNSGYFMDRQGKVIAVLKTGEVVGEWSEFREFLRDELTAAQRYEASETPEEWWH